ncbi:MAG: O-antigen ligase family protein [Bacteroidota bacterium]|nr:O-antigen ligase family protein [Bacteroidota bacterium]
MIIFLYIFLVTVLVLLLYDYKTGIITSLMAVTNFGEFIYVNPNLDIGDFGGMGKVFFMDIFWLAVIIVIFLKRDKLYLLNYQWSLLIFSFLCLIALIIPFLISSFTIKDLISVIRPLGNFLFLPYFVLTITDIKAFNFFERTIVVIATVFIGIQCYEFILQKRIPVRLLEEYNVFYSEDPFSVEFGGVKTGYIWSRIGCLLPFNLLFGCYYFFSERKSYGLFLIGIYLLAIMISLSRIWIIGFGFFLIVSTVFLLLSKENKNYILIKLFSLVASFAALGVILIFASSTFSQIFDIFLLRIDSINDLANKTDSSFLGREYILMQMMNVWMEYPVFGAGFSTITRKLTTNDLGFPNLVTIFGGAGIIMIFVFLKEFYNNVKPLIKNYYILFVSLISVMLMITFMSLFSIDMFYYNSTGAMLFAIGNIILNIGKENPE